MILSLLTSVIIGRAAVDFVMIASLAMLYSIQIRPSCEVQFDSNCQALGTGKAGTAAALRVPVEMRTWENAAAIAAA